VEPHLPAAILVFFDRPYPERQEQIAFALAVANDLNPLTLCRSVDAALALVLSRHVLWVVAALDPRDGGAIEVAGGKLVVARDGLDTPKRRTVARLAERLQALGLDKRAIARALEVDSQELTRLLQRRPRNRGPSPE
jgi:hypothetical protein